MNFSARALPLADFFPSRILPRLQRVEPEYRSGSALASSCRLRPAASGDLRFLWTCLALATQEGMGGHLLTLPTASPYLRGWMRSNDFGFIASRDGRDVGAVWARQFREPDSSPWPELIIAVHPEFRRQGVGQHLLNALALEARQRNHKGLHLQVHPGNPASRLFLRVGFRQPKADPAPSVVATSILNLQLGF
jgi:GNAT superfamily N-acetyltransferase